MLLVRNVFFAMFGRVRLRDGRFAEVIAMIENRPNSSFNEWNLYGTIKRTLWFQHFYSVAE